MRGDVAYLVPRTHIASVLANPELFGFTHEELVHRFRTRHEPIGWEGRARKEILVEVMRRGWIRVRIESGRFSAGIPDRILLNCDSEQARRDAIEGFLELAAREGLSQGERIEVSPINLA